MVQKIPAVIGVSGKCQAGNRNANTGNLTHAVAARRILGDYVDFPTATLWGEAIVERLQANHSHIVIVLANAIRLDNPAPQAARFHKTITENLRKVDLPVVVFGLGSQARRRLAPGDDLVTALVTAPETVELIQLLGERCRKIAVRGAFTAGVLEHFGVKNAEVMGCQSCFWHLTPEFPLTLPNPADASDKPVGFSYTGPIREQQLIKFAMDRNVHMVGQEHFLEYLITQGQDTTEEYAGLAKRFMKLYELGDLHQETYESYIRDYFHMFYDLDSWFEFIKDFRFFYGSRFHGCMTALQAGVPSVWVTHDSRTEELCEHLKLPSVTLRQAQYFTHLEQYYEAADYSAFYAAYPDNYRRLYDYLAAAGVPNRLQPPLEHGAAAVGDAPIQVSSIRQEITDISTALTKLGQQLSTLTDRLGADAGLNRDS